MGTSARIEALFAELCNQETAESRRAYYCAVRSTEGKWKPASLFHRILLAASRACNTEDARAIRIRAEREWLVTANAVLMHSADGRVYKDAVAAGEWLIGILDAQRERDMLRQTLHYL